MTDVPHFATVRTEGALLRPELLARIHAGDSGIRGLRAADYGHAGERLNEAIARDWNRLLAAWSAFGRARRDLEEDDPALRLTRDRWLLPLFETLGYGRLRPWGSQEIDGTSYPISHSWDATPVHLLGCGVDLDTRSPGVAGAARRNPHGLVQEFLNRSPDHLWGIVTNGLQLRLLRDNASLTRQAFVEFDLATLLDGQLYSDFKLLWLVVHASRVQVQEEQIPGEGPAACWLERWHQQGVEEGTRALDQLRKGFETAIEHLGRGFLSASGNAELRERLRSGELDRQDYFRQLLRLVFRWIFLFVAEDRDLLAPSDADPAAKQRYREHYSTARLRRLAQVRRGGSHPDLWRGLRRVQQALWKDGLPDLALPALGGFLFSPDACSDLVASDLPNSALLEAVRALAFVEQDRVLLRVDFRNLGSEELGSVYESLLELHPEIELDSQDFHLDVAAGHERKTTGSYYTPTPLIESLLDTALDPVVEQALGGRRGEDAERALLDLKVVDPAAGSGHFLVAAGRRLARRLAALRTGEDEPAPEATRDAFRDVVGHCLFGVDVNPMALELCKFGLWLEALDPDRPLTFLDHHFQVGNSLLGATPRALREGVPDDAFKPLEGDDREVVKAAKKENKRQRQGERRLDFSAPWDRLGDLYGELRTLETLDDETIEQLLRKEQAWEEIRESEGYRYGCLLADAWCAAFVWRKVEDRDHPAPITEEVFRRIERNPFGIDASTRREIRRLGRKYRFLHWHLAFPGVFRPPDPGEEPDNPHTGWSGGFDVVLGNPPWERVKLQEKEFFSGEHEEIEGARTKAKRGKLIEALAESDDEDERDLYRDFLDEKRRADAESHLLRDSGIYPLCGRGDVNTYSVFAELNRNLVAGRGRVGCIVPSGIATAATAQHFFGDLVDNHSLHSLKSFWEIRRFFPGTDSREAFCLLTLVGRHAVVDEALFAFDLRSYEQLGDPRYEFTLTAADIALLNPNTRTCPIFRTRADAEITKRIYRRLPVLLRDEEEKGGAWGIDFLRMFDMSGSSDLFRGQQELQEEGWTLEGNVFVKDGERYLPLYEAKMVHQFDHRYGDYRDRPPGSQSTQLPDVPVERLKDPYYRPIPRHWLPEQEVRSELEETPQKQWLAAFRDIARSRDERTAILAFLPAFAVGHTSPLLLSTIKPSIFSGLIGALNSVAFDFAVRQKLGGTHLTYTVFRQLPVPTPLELSAPWTFDRGTTFAEWLRPRVLELTYTAWDLQPFAEDLGYDGPPFRWDENRRFELRCEMDAAFFHLYLGTPEEWEEQPAELRELFPTPRHSVEHVMSTFHIVKKHDVKRYGSYRTRDTILQIYDRMEDARTRGRPYQTVLYPPPADPRAAHEASVPASIVAGEDSP